MEKSLFTAKYEAFLAQLRRARFEVGYTQEQLAERLGTTQSFVSKCERGERRLDIVEVHAWCAALGTPFSKFTRRFDKSAARAHPKN